MSNKIKTTVGSHRIELTNLEKALFPGISKGELIRYYLKIAPVMLPHIKDRPLSFQRFPDGINAEGFYQKQAPSAYPEWIKRIPLGVKDIVDYASADSAADLVYFAQQAVIVIHTSLARADKPHNPDLLVFDLDPPADDFGMVKKTALQMRALLEGLDLKCYVKLTGSRGVHLAVPLDRSWDFGLVNSFADRVAGLYQRKHPDETTVEISKAKRGNRIFIDTNRNHFAQTAVAPYSVRAREGAPVAAPITWGELSNADIKPAQFNIENIFDLLANRADPWADIYRHGLPLKRAEGLLQSLENSEKS
ncbi:non-homologous end-joining DNA ligase [Dehalogenimonas alkenigignens]|uniref:DNA ligase D, polymerase domain n=1 Tax=Dehalogenimonas alkenigignens TaxID=1217799 RepID=A0A0W0GH60_9CHLR|nr:non-homologous end-joining DNA ligase [Dehalogenimonas alkenigignens]KTB47869.1 DNA ligase D, polymerase domain [Dehalogenimonas alkenigignens]PVV83934.1 ATP-dependent DNA ligase [Dehalogenimonas alkenigignens]